MFPREIFIEFDLAEEEAGYRVVATGPPGVASAYPVYAQVASPDKAVNFKGVCSVG
jgi:hypothetical protein